MAAGWIFRLDANAYLVLGVPLVVLFQLFIRLQPLRNLWLAMPRLFDDSHVYRTRSNEKASGSPLLSAIFISALWGVWRLPTLSIPSAPAFAAAIPALIIVHPLVGVPFPFAGERAVL
jgi:hypothetical protein